MHLIFRPPLTPSAVLFAASTGPRLRPMPYARLGTLALLSLLLSASEPAAPASQTAYAHPSPEELVRQTVENGMVNKDKDQTHWSFRELVRKDGKLETHQVFQTSAGTIDRLIAINNQPLSPEQQRREDARIQESLADPAEIRKERQKQREDSARQMRMFATFPNAFHYQYAGTEGLLVKLKFEPNVGFVPSTRQEEVFHHLEGMMWIDPEKKQLARIDGTLMSEVRFAAGLLGHLDKGGMFSVRFRPLASGQWVMAALRVDMSGRALLFKTISVQEEREFDDYRRMPDNLSLQQVAELVTKESISPRQTAVASSK
jgi:hypothetical protein